MNRKKICRPFSFGKSLPVYTLAVMLLIGCGAEKSDSVNGGRQNAEVEAEKIETEEMAENNLEGSMQIEDGSIVDAVDKEKTGIDHETAKDTVVNIKALQEENPDIFAWLYVPGTDIDCPVLQSMQSDDYYEGHNAYGEMDEKGAVYTELANLTNMCDFNTVLHGKTSEDGKGGLFAQLYQFADPDFFEKHWTAYLYLDGNLLTYEIFAAYERENTSLIRTYDFTYISGCQKFLDDLYDTRVMGMNFREGWGDLTPYHFLITLTTSRGESANKQFVVFGGLVNDAAGTIDRVMYE